MEGSKVVLISGATRGIGFALAREFGRRGHRVYGTGRTPPGDPSRLPFLFLPMDVTDDRSVREAVARVAGEAGRIDVVVNNAGISLSGPVEETPLETARRVFETNYFGMVRVLRAVLPLMRRQGSGTVVNIGSAGGRIAVPFQAHYSASKFAVEGLTEALSHEVRLFGIRVLLVEPGDVRTGIWDGSEHAGGGEDSAYVSVLEAFHEVKAREMGTGADSPEAVAARIADLVESSTARLRHPVAGRAALYLLARKFLPDRLFLWMVRRNYRIGK